MSTESKAQSLTDLETTESGAIRKSNAMQWMRSLGEADPETLKEKVVPKPSNHTGSTMPEPITRIRVDGDPEFIEEVAKMFNMLLDFEDNDTRLAVNLQQVEDRDTGDLQDDVYALYLSVAERA